MNSFHRLAFLILLPIAGFSQNKSIKFDHIQTSAGLSQSNVITELQDSRGFMWFGTRDGLNKYDGYRFTVYRNDPKNKQSISNSYISAMVEQPGGNLWIATWGGGLNLFIREKGIFVSYQHKTGDPNSIAGNFISSICEDHLGNLWIGTDGSGLDRYNPRQNSFTHFIFNKQDSASISDNFVKAITEDRQGNLWIGTARGGLNLFHPDNSSFTRFQHGDRVPGSIACNDIYTIFEDNSNRLWIGTDGGGLDLFDTKTSLFHHFKNDPHNPQSISANEVRVINTDAKQQLWIGTENGGLSVMNPATETFDNYYHDEIDNSSLGNNSIYCICKDNKGNMWLGTFADGIDLANADDQFPQYKHGSAPNTLSNNKVLCIFEDSKSNVWIGTDGGGVNLFNRKTGTFTHYLHDPKNRNSICGNYVLNITEDANHNLWIGTWGDGITVFNPLKNTYRHFSFDSQDPGSLSNNNAWNIYQDKNHTIWVGTYGGGLNRYDPLTHSFKRYQYDQNNKNGISSNDVESIFDDSLGHLWIGTDGGGLNRFDKKTFVFTEYVHDDQNKNTIASNSLGHLYQDAHGILWIATASGLSAFNPHTETSRNYSVEDGLPGNGIFGILPDDKGHLWISTNRGISCFNPATGKFKNYGPVDGLQGNEFKEQAFCRSRSGELYFGGNNGFNVFFPENIHSITFDPPLVLTGFRIANKKVAISTDADPTALRQDITETKSIQSPFNRSSIEFEFASLNYTDNDRKQYTYMLQGFDSKWNEADDDASASYTNLDPGTYIFKVRGLDNSGHWSPHITSIQLVITPPFWLTWWCKLLAAVGIIGIFIAAYRIRIQAIKSQKKVLEKLVKVRTEQLEHFTQGEKKARVEAQWARRHAEQANQAKSIFLATMSHEIRTPLNGVIGMASLLAETELTDQQLNFTKTISTCGESLLGVINDILDFSKIESGNLDLEKDDFNLRVSVEDILDIFSARAAAQGLDLVYKIDDNVPLQIVGDDLRLRQILSNLISNALKFTLHGEVFVGVQLVSPDAPDELTLRFEVRDTGIGIHETKLNRLFKSFSQVDSSTTRKYGGTGLGLAISEKLVNLMQGTFNVESKVDKGSTFSFTLKTRKGTKVLQPYLQYNMNEIRNKKILVVDDNQTNLAILKSQLELWGLKPVLAETPGHAMLHLSKDPEIVLVLTDMQMPYTDGIELTQNIKRLYPSLPVILLSSVGEDCTKSNAHLFTAILNKPVRQYILSKQLLAALGPKQNEPSPMKKTVEEVPEKFSAAHPFSILVAEDNEVNQKVIIYILRKLGYEPCLAENGLVAVEKAIKKKYDIILMDMQMPEMDGLQATKRVRESLVSQPVIIALTANAMEKDQEECLRAGMDDYLSKPVKLEDITKMLEKWTAERNPIINN